jgi:outer membrane protein assembly factor BamD (BamD/ComL family)
MSVPAVLNALFQIPDFFSAKSNANKFKQEFQQLGQDLQSGNLSKAQSDFDAIQPNNVPGLSSSSSSTGLASAFNQLATDLKSGNLSAAQQDYATVQQDLQSSAVSGHHHHHHSAGLDTSSSSQNSLEQRFSQLGQDLQSGNLSNAQSAYAALQQEFAQLSSALTTSSAPSSNALNVTV